MNPHTSPGSSRAWLLAVTVCVAGVHCFPTPVPAADADARGDTRPNILMIVTDDQAPWALGLSGHPHANTPHMDRLFREGVYLPNAMTTTPVCSPSRASLLTSRYGSEVSITDWLHPQRDADTGLDPALATWPRLLADAGYRTGLVGKWHLGTADRFHPTRFGYQHFMGFRAGGTKVEDPVLEVDGTDQQLSGLTTDLLVDEAIEFIRRESERPFLLSLHFRAPHSPWLPVADADWKPFKDLQPQLPQPDYPKLDIPRAERMTREYLASVAGVDRNLGRLMHELDRLQLAQKTVVIYTSDHGYNMGHNGIWHKGNGMWLLTEPPPATENVPSGWRPNMYDLSLRVPTAVRWPGVLEPGRVLSETVSNQDWFPTILAMAKVELPGDVIIRGRNALPLLKGEAADWENDFYAEYSLYQQAHTHMRMYRTAQWKLVRDFLNPDRDELYDLRADPAESQNLIDSSETDVVAVKQRLHGRILARMRELNDPVLKTIGER